MVCLFGFSWDAPTEIFNFCYAFTFCKFCVPTIIWFFLRVPPYLLKSLFHANISFLHHLKMSRNQRFFDVFRGYRNGTLVWKGLSYDILFRSHPLSKYAKFSEKPIFLTPWYAQWRVRIRGLEILVFRKILRMCFMDAPLTHFSLMFHLYTPWNY